MPPTERREELRRHHIYFDPEFMVYRLNKSVGNINVHGTRFFVGPRIRYEYLFPKAFYFGVDIASGGTRTDFKAFRGGKPLSWRRASRTFVELELRLGYTFFQGERFFATPFLGGGVYGVVSKDHYNHQGLKETSGYFVGGVKLKYRVHQKFNVGFNVKLLYVGEDLEFRLSVEKVKDHHSYFGGEIGVPLGYYLSKDKKWSLEAEPYFRTLGFSKLQMLYGARILAKYNF